MPTDSVAKKIIIELKARLETIDGTGEFFTDVSQNVQLGNLPVKEGTPAFLALLRESRVREPYAAGTLDVESTIIFRVEGYVLADLEEPYFACMDLEADVDRSLENKLDPSLGGLLSLELQLEQQDLEPRVAAANYEYFTTLIICRYTHTYGDPSNVS